MKGFDFEGGLFTYKLIHAPQHRLQADLSAAAEGLCLGVYTHSPRELHWPPWRQHMGEASRLFASSRAVKGKQSVTRLLTISVLLYRRPYNRGA